MQNIIGVDEVGRGAWAGPMLFCAVSLSSEISGLKDSKKLSKIQREKLALEIKQKAGFIGYGWVSPSEVDDLGLTRASKLACRRALKNSDKSSIILLDGKIDYVSKGDSWEQVKCVINGDETVPEISAASILAKVERDKFMLEQAKVYPGYGFEKNVGYGTKLHLEAIERIGLTPLHRWSFKPIKNIMDNYEA